MALIMVMVLALLVYLWAERKLRQQLAESGETVLNQVGKPTQTPTMRRKIKIEEVLNEMIAFHHIPY